MIKLLYAMTSPSDFEVAVFSWIAASSNDSALHDQLARVAVTERNYTVVGCYSSLSLPSDIKLSVGSYAKHGPLTGPYFESEVVKHGGGTLLWFKEGAADCLEIFTYGDYFPEDHVELGNFQLSNGI